MYGVRMVDDRWLNSKVVRRTKERQKMGGKQLIPDTTCVTRIRRVLEGNIVDDKISKVRYRISFNEQPVQEIVASIQ